MEFGDDDGFDDANDVDTDVLRGDSGHGRGSSGGTDLIMILVATRICDCDFTRGSGGCSWF